MAEGSKELTVPDTISVSDSDDLSSRSISRKNSLELMTSGSVLCDDSTSLFDRLRSPTPSDLHVRGSRDFLLLLKVSKEEKAKKRRSQRIYQLVSA